jgi:hypothetical protein
MLPAFAVPRRAGWANSILDLEVSTPPNPQRIMSTLAWLHLGLLIDGSKPAFETMRNTSAAAHLDIPTASWRPTSPARSRSSSSRTPVARRRHQYRQAHDHHQPIVELCDLLRSWASGTVSSRSEPGKQLYNIQIRGCSGLYARPVIPIIHN